MSYRREFYVCFRPALVKRWWQILTGPKRQHIFLITSCNKTSCVMIDMSEGGIGLYYIDRSEHDVVSEYYKGGVEVLRFKTREDEMKRPNCKIMRTCVDIAKDFLGINNFWVFTPDQLYKEIVRLNKTR